MGFVKSKTFRILLNSSFKCSQEKSILKQELTEASVICQVTTFMKLLHHLAEVELKAATFHRNTNKIIQRTTILRGKQGSLNNYVST